MKFDLADLLACDPQAAARLAARFARTGRLEEALGIFALGAPPCEEAAHAVCAALGEKTYAQCSSFLECWAGADGERQSKALFWLAGFGKGKEALRWMAAHPFGDLGQSCELAPGGPGWPEGCEAGAGALVADALGAAALAGNAEFVAAAARDARFGKESPGKASPLALACLSAAPGSEDCALALWKAGFSPASQTKLACWLGCAGPAMAHPVRLRALSPLRAAALSGMPGKARALCSMAPAHELELAEGSWRSGGLALAGALGNCGALGELCEQMGAPGWEALDAAAGAECQTEWDARLAQDLPGPGLARERMAARHFRRSSLQGQKAAAEFWAELCGPAALGAALSDSACREAWEGLCGAGGDSEARAGRGDLKI